MHSRPRPYSSPFSAFHYRRHRELLVHCLVFLLLAQVFVPMQSHTRWVASEDGHVIEMCTLQGIVLVDAETGEKIAADAPSVSPAMMFSDLLSHALDTVTHAETAWVALIPSETAPPRLGTPSSTYSHYRLIRAPPLTS